MKVIKGNIWDYHKKGHYIVIPTNGFVKSNGECVMGAGLAKQAREKYPNFPMLLGTFIKSHGNVVHYINPHMLSFPVKHHWKQKADLPLIEQSTRNLAFVGAATTVDTVYLPKVGCGNGKLNWKDVEPILDKYLNQDDKFVVVDFK